MYAPVIVIFMLYHTAWLSFAYTLFVNRISNSVEAKLSSSTFAGTFIIAPAFELCGNSAQDELPYRVPEHRNFPAAVGQLSFIPVTSHPEYTVAIASTQ